MIKEGMKENCIDTFNTSNLDLFANVKKPTLKIELQKV